MDTITPYITARYICEFFIGDIRVYREPVSIPDSALDVTAYKWAKVGTRYCEPFDSIIRPALGPDCHDIWRTLDGKFWLIFPSAEDAALFKLTHL